MRKKRLDKYRKYRHKKIRKIILYAIVFPSTSILIGYILTSIFLLPIIGK